MKMYRCAFIALMGGLLALNGLAQGPGRMDGPAGPEGRTNRPRHQGERGEGPGGPMTDLWLQHLQEVRPDEFGRLRDLREKDPAAFHKEVRQHMRQEIGKKLQRERPCIFNALEALPEEDHEWLLNRLFGSGDRGERGLGMGPGLNSGGGYRPDDAEMGELRGLSKAYRAATNDPERSQARQTLRDNLQKSFNRKHEGRRQELDQMEVKLREARSLLQERDQNRESIIDRRLKELTEGAPAPVEP